MSNISLTSKPGFPWAQLILAVLAFGIAGYAIAVYLTGAAATAGFVQGKVFYQNFHATPLWTAALLVHASGGSLALIAGGLQWVVTRSALRSRHRKGFRRFHIVTGLVYLIAILAGSVGAAYMAVEAMGGLIASAGFMFLDLFWVAATIAAFYWGNRVRKCQDSSIIEKLRARHRAWAVRSFALTAAAITLRIWLPLFTGALGLDFIASYIVIAWLAWVPNLVIAELMVRNKKTPVSVKAAT